MKVNKEQASYFKKAVEFYQCRPDEVELMKAAYERDPEGAAICFAAIAAHVELMTGPRVVQEHSLTGEQFLKIGVVAKEMEARSDAQ